MKHENEGEKSDSNLDEKRKFIQLCAYFVHIRIMNTYSTDRSDKIYKIMNENC